MKELAAVMVEAMLLEFDRTEVLRRFSDPGWFQAFGCTLGFDWHSSGLTTVVCGALKEALNPRAHELGLYVAGGKGSTSRKTPQEISQYAEESAPDLPVEGLQDSSRRVAQVDTSALQDDYDLYHHVFFVDRDANWSVIQQGINDDSGWARRYHWFSDGVDDFLDDPHEGIRSPRRQTSLNLASEDSEENRDISVEMVNEDPVKTLQEFNRLMDFWDDTSRRLKLPNRHSLPRKDHLERSLGKLYDRPPDDFQELMDVDGVGQKTVRALSMVAEVVWGAEPSYQDPARYSFAHGGKDGYPRPVDHEEYRRSIDVLSNAIRRANVGDDSKLKAFKRLKSTFSSEDERPFGQFEGNDLDRAGGDQEEGSDSKDDLQYTMDF
jgi:hypothetical protein